MTEIEIKKAREFYGLVTGVVSDEWIKVNIERLKNNPHEIIKIGMSYKEW